MRLRSLAALLILALAAGLTFKTITEGAESPPASSANRAPAAASARGTASAPAAKKAENKCVACHAFDKLIARPAKYTAPSGEKINPHRYVPHNSKLAKDIPQCTRCHTEHPLPRPKRGSIDLSKVNVQWCYGCHHEKNLKTCKDCHP
jgi:hypothetical protein